MRSYFTDIAGVGDLYLDYVFFEFEEEPILFVCSDSEGLLYLCVCTEIRYEQDWIITLVDKVQLEEMIKQKKDIRSAFIESKNIILINMDIDGVESSKVVNYEKVNPVELPDEGVYIQCDIHKAIDYLKEQKFIFNTSMKVPLVEERLDRGIEYTSYFIVGCIRDSENLDSIAERAAERLEKQRIDAYLVEEKNEPYKDKVVNEQSDSWMKLSHAA